MADKPVTINTSIDLSKVPEINIALSTIKDPKTGIILNTESSKNPKTGTTLSANQTPIPKNLGMGIKLTDPKNPPKTGANLATILDPRTFARQ